jgi:hypothetical protein
MPSSWHSSASSIDRRSAKKEGAASGEADSRRLSYNQRGEHKHQENKHQLDIGRVISSHVGWTQASAPAAPLLDHLAAARAAQATRTSILSKAN